MFKSLKDKLLGMFKKTEEVVEKPKKTEKKSKVKEKTEKTTKAKESQKKESKSKEPKPEESKNKEKNILPKEKPNKNIERLEEAQEEKAEALEEQVQEEEIEIEKQEEETQSFFSKLKKKLLTSELTEDQFNEIFDEFELTLLENNVALEAVDKIRKELSKDLVGISVKRDQVESTILESLKSAILSLLIEPLPILEQIKKHRSLSSEPFVIVFFGINGAGKTTSIAKVAHFLRKNKISTVLAAGDTFRAASIEQLETHAKKLDVPIIKSNYGSDPASVGFEAIKYAKAHKLDSVLIDTAGRMYTASNLLKEMEKIIRVTSPHLKIFVAESITGNDATSQAKTFNESVGIDGIILSKADIDEKAGTILSVSHVTGKPIYFLGTGQEYSDLTPFTKSTVLKNLGLD